MPARFRSLVLAGALALGLSVPAQSQDDGAPIAPALPEQVELSHETLEAFLDSYPELQALGEEFEAEYGPLEENPDDPVSGAMAYARFAEAKARMEAVLAEHDIGSTEEWAQIAYSVMLAYSFAESGENIGGMDQEMSEALAQIEEDPNIPEDQKQLLAAMVREQLEHLGRLRPPPANIELAERYSDRIRETVEPTEQE